VVSPSGEQNEINLNNYFGEDDTIGAVNF